MRQAIEGLLVDGKICRRQRPPADAYHFFFGLVPRDLADESALENAGETLLYRLGGHMCERDRLAKPVDPINCGGGSLLRAEMLMPVLFLSKEHNFLHS